MSNEVSEYRARRALRQPYQPRHAKQYTWERAQVEAAIIRLDIAYAPKHAGRRA